MATSTKAEAAAILRRITEALPLPPRVESYLRGYADALDTPKR